MQSQTRLVAVFSFAVTPSKKSAENIIPKVEAAVSGIDDTTCSEFYLEVLRILRKHITRGKLRVLHTYDTKTKNILDIADYKISKHTKVFKLSEVIKLTVASREKSSITHESAVCPR